MFHLFAQPEQQSVKAFHLASQWRIALNVRQRNKGSLQVFDTTRMMKLKTICRKNTNIFSWLQTCQCLFQVPSIVMTPALFKLLGSSKSFPCPMPRLRRDSTDNELARDGSLVTALGLHFPPNLWCISHVCVKEGKKRKVLWGVLGKKGYAFCMGKD